MEGGKKEPLYRREGKPFTTWFLCCCIENTHCLPFLHLKKDFCGFIRWLPSTAGMMEHVSCSADSVTNTLEFRHMLRLMNNMMRPRRARVQPGKKNLEIWHSAIIRFIPTWVRHLHAMNNHWMRKLILDPFRLLIAPLHLSNWLAWQKLENVGFKS